MKEKKIKIKGREVDLIKLFCIFMSIGMGITIIALFITRGELFSHIFFQDKIDTGMDFFHSIEYTRGRKPYENWNTLYPPLANFIFYLLYRLVPIDISRSWEDTFDSSISARGTEIDLRTNQATMVLFIIFIILTVMLIAGIVQKYFEFSEMSFGLAAMVISSYGMLWAYERGNIIIITVACSMIFVFFYDSQNKYVQEIAIIALAIAAALKLYPALFGIMLLYNKQYKKAIRTLIYGACCFVLPVFVFKEGLTGIKLFLEILTTHTEVETLILAAEGFSLTQFVASVILQIQQWTNVLVNETIILEVFPKISMIVSGVLLLAGFRLRNKWQQALVCVVSMLLYSYQAYYALSFLLIPLLVMIKEDKILGCSNIIPFAILVVSQIVLPIRKQMIGVWDVRDLRFQVCLLGLVGYIIFEAVAELILLRKQKTEDI